MSNKRKSRKRNSNQSRKARKQARRQNRLNRHIKALERAFEDVEVQFSETSLDRSIHLVLEKIFLKETVAHCCAHVDTDSGGSTDVYIYWLNDERVCIFGLPEDWEYKRGQAVQGIIDLLGKVEGSFMPRHIEEWSVEGRLIGSSLVNINKYDNLDDYNARNVEPEPETLYDWLGISELQ